MTILSDGSDTIITAPPDEIWEATEMVREEATATIHALYNLDIDEIIALNPNHDPVQLRTDMEHRKQPIEWKLERLGITLADLDLLTLQKEFYTKYIDAAGIAILSNDSVADEHLIEARDIIIALTAKRPELRDMLSTQRDNVIHGVTTEGLQTFYGQGFYMVLIDSNTVSFADMPELFDLHPYDIWYDGSAAAREDRFKVA